MNGTRQLAPAPRPIPVAAGLLTTTLASIIVLGLMTARRKREAGLPSPGHVIPPEAQAEG